MPRCGETPGAPHCELILLGARIPEITPRRIRAQRQKGVSARPGHVTSAPARHSDWGGAHRKIAQSQALGPRAVSNQEPWKRVCPEHCPISTVRSPSLGTSLSSRGGPLGTCPARPQMSGAPGPHLPESRRRGEGDREPGAGPRDGECAGPGRDPEGLTRTGWRRPRSRVSPPPGVLIEGPPRAGGGVGRPVRSFTSRPGTRDTERGSGTQYVPKRRFMRWILVSVGLSFSNVES